MKSLREEKIRSQRQRRKQRRKKRRKKRRKRRKKMPLLVVLISSEEKCNKALSPDIHLIKTTY